MKSSIVTKLAWIVCFELVGMGIGYFSGPAGDGWYEALDKPSFNPPNWAFPIAWTLLYALMALAGERLWRGRDRIRDGGRLFGLFALQQLLNWGWTPIFFSWHQIGFALAWIVALNAAVAAVIALAWQRDRVVSLLLLPYLAWGLFATLLNWRIWSLN